MRGALRTVVVATLALLAAGCTSSRPSAPPTSAGSSAPVASTPVASPSTIANPKLDERCVNQTDGISSVPFTFAAGDGTRLFGLEMGRGPRGVVMVHELGGQGLCGWLPYGKYLADHGVHVLLYDTRCTGESACPTGAKTDDVVSDVRGAKALLGRHGARNVAVVGASFGGAIALTSAATVPGIRACVVLSGDIWDRDLGPMTGEQAAPRLGVALLYAVATRDSDRLPTARRIVGTVKPALVTLKVIDGDEHGWDLLQDFSTGRFTPLATQVLTFLNARLR